MNELKWTVTMIEDGRMVDVDVTGSLKEVKELVKGWTGELVKISPRYE